ncbi:hypothetical protein A9995_00995 [Erythrobacter sp. QSSC1-22B]|uniref:hypothetical protein n=1 Tax=Erythrobacter sp. QSSC1-22B TaxID=1860125 RepID=UPI000804BBA4|nr:hypothetical protein [Erythrobacter sp. QSSC1-22B]OBX20336.1 hypothetical protein A9995_00995 [Erythrobacter sp. QSSC1-22B]
MRKYLILAAFATLAACGASDAPVDGDTARGTGMDAAPASDDPAGAEMVGTYEVIAEDGTAVLQTVNADGTYVETVDGDVIERGTWHQKGDQMCYDPEGDAIEQCFIGGKPGNQGSFSVETDGGTATVRRVEDADASEPAATETDPR